MKKKKQFVGYKWWLKSSERPKPIKRHKRLFTHKVTQGDLVMAIESLVERLSKKYYDFRIPKLSHKSRKYLVGVYGNLVHIGRKEGIFS